MGSVMITFLIRLGSLSIGMIVSMLFSPMPLTAAILVGVFVGLDSWRDERKEASDE